MKLDLLLTVPWDYYKKFMSVNLDGALNMTRAVSRIPIERMGTPEDLVGACLYLLSDEANWVTGQILNVDGGQIIRS